MSAKLPPRHLELYHAIDEILWRDWDPIGVMGDTDWPRDEYDCLLSPLLRRLEQGCPEAEIAAYLEKEIKDHFGLDPSYYNFGSVASRLIEWYRKHWSGTAS